MAKTKISEFSSTPGNNTDIDGINIAEGCAPSGINDAIRELMAQLKDWQAGTSNDPMTIGSTGSLTLSYGTANGVAYLNGSKVLTTGSGLVFDGTNLGIGTSSPSTKLHVSGQSRFADSSNAANYITIGAGANAPYGNASISTTTAGLSIVAEGAGNITFRNNGSEAMRIDTANNLGLGVTPSAWSTPAFNFGSNAVGSLSVIGTTTSLGNNINYNSGYKYTTSSTAGLYQISGNTHYWFTAPSGTAGNAISFTQAMTLDASGRLLLGTTSASSGIGAGGLDVYDRIAVGTGSAGTPGLHCRDSTGTGLFFGTNIIGFSTGSTERARIDSSGFFKTRANGGAYFGGSYNEIVNNNNVSGDIILVVGNKAGSNTNNTSSYLLIAGDNAADRFYVYGNGNVVNINNSYGALSDIKLKENITDATPKLEKLQQVRVVNYNVKGETQNQIGVIAQELEQVFPGMIDESPDRDAEGNDLGTTTKSVKYSVFVPMLIKAMQEMKQIVDAQAARIAALEAK